MERGGVFPYSLTRYLEGVGESVVLPALCLCSVFIQSPWSRGRRFGFIPTCEPHRPLPPWGVCTVPLHVGWMEGVQRQE